MEDKKSLDDLTKQVYYEIVDKKIDTCGECTEDGENGSCLLGLDSCKWY